MRKYEGGKKQWRRKWRLQKGWGRLFLNEKIQSSHEFQIVSLIFVVDKAYCIIKVGFEAENRSTVRGDKN